jgi:hypothetical protein
MPTLTPRARQPCCSGRDHVAERQVSDELAALRDNVHGLELQLFVFGIGTAKSNKRRNVSGHPLSARYDTSCSTKSIAGASNPAERRVVAACALRKRLADRIHLIIMSTAGNAKSCASRVASHGVDLGKCSRPASNLADCRHARKLVPLRLYPDCEYSKIL